MSLGWIELLVKSVDHVIAGSAISEEFLGFTLFAIVPSATEYVNAILFALHDNIALRYEEKEGKKGKGKRNNYGICTSLSSYHS